MTLYKINALYAVHCEMSSYSPVHGVRSRGTHGDIDAVMAALGA